MLSQTMRLSIIKYLLLGMQLSYMPVFCLLPIDDRSPYETWAQTQTVLTMPVYLCVLCMVSILYETEVDQVGLSELGLPKTSNQ